MRYNNIINHKNFIKYFFTKYLYCCLFTLKNKDIFYENLFKSGNKKNIESFDFYLLKLNKNVLKNFFNLSFWTGNLYLIFFNTFNDNIFLYLKKSKFFLFINLFKNFQIIGYNLFTFFFKINKKFILFIFLEIFFKFNNILSYVLKLIIYNLIFIKLNVCIYLISYLNNMNKFIFKSLNG